MKVPCKSLSHTDMESLFFKQILYPNMRRNNISQLEALPQLIIFTVCQIVQQDQSTETTFCLRRDINKLPSIKTICDKHGGEKKTSDIWRMDCENDDAIFFVTDGKACHLLNGNRQLQRFMKKRWDETWRLNSSHHWCFCIVPLIYNCILKVMCQMRCQAFSFHIFFI